MVRKRWKLAQSVLTLLLCVTLAFGSFGDAGAAAQSVGGSSAEKSGKGVTVASADGVNSELDQLALSDENAEEGFLSDNDLVWVIAVLKGDSLLDTAKAENVAVDEYARSEEGAAQNAALISKQDSFVRSLGGLAKDSSYHYTSVFNGVALQIRYGDLEKLENNSNLKDVILSDTYAVPEAVTENLVNVWEDTGIYKSENVTDYTGQGTVVAVLDTGLDYTHSAFQMKNFPDLDTDNLAITRDDVAANFDFLAAKALSEAKAEAEDKESTLQADDLYISEKVPFAYDYADSDADVYPVNDHGTHVAGIIGGKDDVITGVAVNTQLAIMKVFENKDEGAPTTAILAGLSDAVVMGVDAINMSLGSSCGFTREEDDDAVNEIYDSIKEAGICLIVAASNDYSSAYNTKWGNTNLASNPDSGTVGSPASYEASMAVASISGVKTAYLVADGEKDIYFKESAKSNGDNKNFVSEMLGDKSEGTFDYVVVPGTGETGNYAGIDVTGKIAVIKRGISTFENKIDLAQEMGAIGVVIYNNVSGTISMSIGKSTIPSCSVTMDVGKYLEEKGSGTFYLSKSNLAGPFMSEFSSWGVLPDLELKPDITAHGGDIYSAVREGYDHYSGTSMACPNMAGAIILIRQYVKEKFPELSPYEVTELTYQLVMSTATIAYNEVGNPYSPRKQGAGLADIGKAVSTGAYLYVEGENKTKLSLGDDPAKDGVYTLKFNLKNLSETALSYRIDPIVMTESLSADGFTVAEMAYMLEDCTFSYSTKTIEGPGGRVTGDTVTVLGSSDIELTVEIRLSDAAKKYLDDNFINGMYVEGYVELISQNKDAINLNIPYLAFYGDWTQAPMLDVTQYEEGESANDPSILEEDKLTADVIGTIPVGEFRISQGNGEYDEAYWGLGLTGYTLADGYETPVAIEDKASLSQNLDGAFSLRGISAGLLRGAKRTEMSIYDAYTGEQVFTRTTYNSRKAYGMSGSGGLIEVDFNVNELGLANNRKYTFEMECFLDVEGDQNPSKNTFSFSFYIDNEAPVLVEEETVLKYDSNATTGKITRRYLDLAFYDNHYIQGFYLATYDSVDSEGNLVNSESLLDGMIPTPDFTRGNVNNYKLDITEYWTKIQAKGGKLYVEVVDYAKNRQGYFLTLDDVISPIEGISFKETSKDPVTGEEIYRGYTVRPNGQVDLNRYIIVEPRGVVTDPVVWTSSDESVATVVDGIVTGIAGGDPDQERTATITAASPDGKYQASLKITVKGTPLDDISITGITLSETVLNLLVGETREITATVTPYNTTVKDYELVWSSGDAAKLKIEQTDDPNTVKLTALESTYDRKTTTNRSFTLVVSIRGTSISSSCTVSIEDEFEVEGRYLKSYNGRGDENGVVTVPDDLGIVNIYRYAFMNNPYIKEIILPEGVEEIEEAAIYGCENLEKVVLPESCTKLDKWAVAWNPKLSDINLEHVVSIGELAFYNSQSLEAVDLSHVAFIGPYAFGMCQKLKRVDLSNLKYMGNQAFVQCTGLEEIVTGPYTPIGDYAFALCSSLTSVELNGTDVGTYAFAQCTALTKVTVNGDIASIGAYAFYGCTGLDTLDFRGTVGEIGDFAFANCTALTEVKLPNGLKTLGFGAFAECSALSSVTANTETQLTDVGIAAFAYTSVEAFKVSPGSKYLEAQDGILYDKGLKTLVLFPFASTIARTTFVVPESVAVIGAGAFSYVQNLNTVNFSNVERVEYGAFAYSNLTAMSGTGNIRHIGDSAFYQTALKKAEVPANAEYIGNSAFAYTDASSSAYQIVIPESVAYMGNNVFAYCTGVSGFENRSSLEEIPYGAFAYCTGIVSITADMFGSAKRVGDFAFAGCSKLKSVSFDGSDIAAIGEAAFQGCTALTSVTLPAGMTEIAPYTFAQTGLTEIVVPETVTSVGEYAFYEAAELSNFYYTAGGRKVAGFNNIVSVGESAFFNTNIESLDAPNLEIIGASAFAYTAENEKKPLSSVNLPKVKEIGGYAFANAVNLTSARLNIASAETIGEFAFYNNVSLTAAEIPNARSVGASAFYGCVNLSSVRMDSAETIAAEAFSGTKISSLELPASLSGIAVRAFAGMESLSAVTVAEENGTYFAKDNVVYRYLPKDRYELTFYPQAKQNKTLTILESTVRIEAYAFADNRYIETVNAPDTLKAIGSGAFFNANGLKTLNLNCVVAPVLESEYDGSLGMTYNNFIVGYGDEVSLTVTTPKNAQGYDSMLWSKYIGETETRTDVQRHEDTIQIEDNIKEWNVETLTADDVTAITNLKRRYDLLDSAQKAYISADLVAKLDELVARAAELAEQPEEKPDPDEGDEPDDPEVQDGCGSAVAAELSAGVLLIGAALFVFRRKRA